MKKLVFAAIAAMVMVSVSNVFAVSKMASDSQVAPVDTVAPATPTDSTVVETPVETPAETPTESVDTTQKEAPVQTEEKVEENAQEKVEENTQEKTEENAQQTNEVQQTTEPSTVAE